MQTPFLRKTNLSNDLFKLACVYFNAPFTHNAFGKRIHQFLNKVCVMEMFVASAFCCLTFLIVPQTGFCPSVSCF